jgi:hypothetical protein
MILVELALQGVKGLPDVVRLPFKTGVNLAFLPDASQRRALLDLIYHCLFPDPGRGSATTALAEPGAEAARAALTFYGRDKVTYRLIRELVTGAIKLYRFDAEAKKYRLFTASAAEAAQYVRVQQQLPDEVSFERLFVFSPESMPSRQGKARTRSGVGVVSGADAVAPSGPGLPPARFLSGVMARGSSIARAGGELAPPANISNALVRSELALEESTAQDGLPASLEEKKALLLRLRADLDMVTRANRAQQEIDQLNARKFEISERAEGVAKLVAERTQLQARIGQDADLEGLPPRMEERLRTFEEREERFRGEEGKVMDELLRIDQEVQQDHVLPLHQDRYFLGAAGVGVFAVVLAAALGRPMVGLVNIPAAMVAVGAAFRFVSDLERQALRGVRRRAVEERLERLHKQHDLDTGVTRRLMEKAGVDSPSSLLERVEAHNGRLARLAELDAQIGALRASEGVRQEEAELAEIRTRLEVLEGEVMGAAGALHGAETLRRRVEALERDLGPDVPPRLKSPPLGVPRPRSRGESSISVDLTGDLVAQSAFSSHLAAASPLATGEFGGLPTGDLPFVRREHNPRASASASDGLIPVPRAAAPASAPARAQANLPSRLPSFPGAASNISQPNLPAVPAPPSARPSPRPPPPGSPPPRRGRWSRPRPPGPTWIAPCSTSAGPSSGTTTTTSPRPRRVGAPAAPRRRGRGCWP